MQSDISLRWFRVFCLGWESHWRGCSLCKNNIHLSQHIVQHRPFDSRLYVKNFTSDLIYNGMMGYHLKGEIKEVWNRCMTHPTQRHWCTYFMSYGKYSVIYIKKFECVYGNNYCKPSYCTLVIFGRIDDARVNIKKPRVYLLYVQWSILDTGLSR